MHLHINRGKQSLVLDLRTARGRRGVPASWSRDADVVIEAMRPGGLDRRGLGYEELKRDQPQHRVLHHLGLRHDRPLRRAAEPRHRLRHVGRPREARDRRGRLLRTSPSTRRSASTPARCSVRSACSPAIIGARATGEGCHLEIAQSDAAGGHGLVLAARRWKAYERPEDEVTGNTSRQLRAPRARHRRHARRRPLPVLRDQGRPPRAVHGVGAGVLEELLRGRRAPRAVRAVAGRKYADHAKGNRELQAHLRDDLPDARPPPSGSTSATRDQHARSPRSTPRRRSPTTRSSRTGSLDAGRASVGADSCRRRSSSSTSTMPRPTKAPTVGQHTDEVLRSTCSATTTSASPRCAKPARSADPPSTSRSVALALVAQCVASRVP